LNRLAYLAPTRFTDQIAVWLSILTAMPILSEDHPPEVRLALRRKAGTTVADQLSAAFDNRTLQRLGLFQSSFWCLVGLFCLIAAVAGPPILLVIGSTTAAVGLFTGFTVWRLLPR
jgi:hypothetical protein